MKTSRFSEVENDRICTACCMISVFSLVLINPKDNEKIHRMNGLIVENDWDELLKNEQWADCLKAMTDIINPIINPVKREFDFLAECFGKEISAIIGKDNAYLFDKKHGEGVKFCELPIGKKFYFITDAYHVKHYNNNAYVRYYIKDNSTGGHVCFSTETNLPVGSWIPVDPETTVIYLAIESL